ncbi:hypothetical protein I600_2002 [Maribacter dokdonensis DSW-8]|nr:hypothetical protein I600_2002 [Maribacter dokdonensis DSW-8]
MTIKNRLLSAELDGVEDKKDELQAIKELYRALGGGWMN